jgi:hypothetical protein
MAGPSLDAAVFVEVAERMRDGAHVYSEVWDHKPPGIYIVLVAGQTVLPFLSGWLVSWLLSLLATAGTGALVQRCARGLGASPGASLAAAAITVVIMAEYLLSLGGGLTEPIATLALAGALRIGIRSGRGPWARGAIVGALLAIGLLVSVQAAAGAAAIVALLLSRSPRLPVGLALLAGFLIPMAAVAVWLLAVGVLPAALDAVVTYAGAYRAIGAVTGAVLSGPVVAWTLLAMLFIVVPAAHGALSGTRQRTIARGVTYACLGWVLLGIVSFFVQGRFMAHYAIPLAIPLGVLCGFGIDRMAAFAARRPVSGAAPLVVTLTISAIAAVIAGGMELGPILRDHERSLAVASVIRERPSADGRVWVWGNEPEVYLDARELSTTPYVYLYPLVTPGYGSQELVARALQALEADPPAFIIDAGSSAPGQPGFQQLLIPRPLASDGRDLDLLDPLRAFVRDRYEELAVADGWVVYALRESTAAWPGSGSSQRLRAATLR